MSTRTDLWARYLDILHSHERATQTTHNHFSLSIDHSTAI